MLRNKNVFIEKKKDLHNNMEREKSTKYIQFDGSNFNNWKFRIQVLLEEKELLEFIETPLVDLVEDIDDLEEESKIRMREKKCKSILVQCIHDSQLEYIKDKKYAKEIFDSLKAVFERASVAGQLLLRKQLLTMKYADGADMQKHFLVFDKNVRDLKAIGATMEEIDIICHLLLTLPKSFDTLVTAIETIDPTKLTLEFVKSRILDEFGKRSCAGTSKMSNDSVAMNSSRPKVKCFKCGKIGHYQSQCRSQEKSSKWNGNRNNDFTRKSASFTKEQEDEYLSEASSFCTFISEDNNEAFIVDSQAQSAQCNVEGELKFVMDSGATDYMVNDKSYFDEMNGIKPISIAVAKDGAKLISRERGNISVKTIHMHDSPSRTIKNVLYVEDLKCNLMSVARLCDKGYEVTFNKNGAMVSKNGETVFVASRNGMLYEVIFQVEKKVFAGIADENSQNLWHSRLCHLNVYDMKKLITNEMVNGLEKFVVNTSEKFCEPCVVGKQCRLPFSKKNVIRSSRLLELIHTDVFGRVSEPAWDGSNYFVSFTDDFSRVSTIYCIERKSEVFEKFKEFVAMAESQHCTKVEKVDCTKVAKLRADNGGEYISNEMKFYCKEKGIQLLLTVAYNPEMNGIAERLNRTLVEKARTMLLASNLSKRFWNEAILTANYIKNRSPTSAHGDQFNNKTPAEIWFKSKPDLSHIRVFGSICYNHVPKDKRSKLEPKATKCIMLGYGLSPSTYRLWDIENDKLIIGRNVTFNEKLMFGQGKSQTTTIELDDSEEEDDCVENIANNEPIDIVTEPIDVPVTLRRSNRERRPVERYDASVAHYSLNAETFIQNDPVSISGAQQRHDWNNWKDAIDAEYKALTKNGTWILCDLPPGRNPISCKWTFKLKRKANGDVDKYKARLVARGFTQEKGFDYSETYSPTAKLTTFRVLMATANHFGYYIGQMDVNSAFLNGELKEEIYMQQPEGFIKDKSKVCKLIKSLYGLKQASRVWYQRFDEFIIRKGFKRCESDQCLYTKFENNDVQYILLFVDDLIIISNTMDNVKTIKRTLGKEFEMTDIEKVESYLGIHIQQDRENGIISLGQPQYMKNLLKKFKMENCKSAATPMEVGLNLPIVNDAVGNENNQPYRQLIGCLIHATQTIRPDLCASTFYLSRFQHCYTDEHFTHAKRILRYIQGTGDLKLIYNRNENADILAGYSDSDWAGDQNDRKSTSGYIFKVFGNVVSWSSNKQSTISLSSTEAEYYALAEAICETKWLRNLLSEMGIECANATTIFEDNQSCIRAAENPRTRKRMKHIDIKYKFIHDAIEKKEINIEYIPSSEQIADIMTKSLGKNLFQKHRASLNLNF